ncbi:MAG: CDP-glycerol glycerophosphotransferase family protein [Bdellovibrionales bacterium]
MTDPGNPSLEQRLAALEEQLARQNEQLMNQARELATLNLWQQGRLFSYIARLFPKTRSVIFLHADFFGDNVKYAFLAFRALAERYNIGCHFLVNNPQQRDLLAQSGLPVLPAMNEWSMDHLRILMSAKVLVACDHFTPLSWSPPLPYFLLQGARLVQMWHGIPLKEIGFVYSDAPQSAFQGLRLSSTGPADVFVAPGARWRSLWRQWFAFREFAALGYPRNDALLREAMGEELINVDTEALVELRAAREGGRGAIFYAPTFRDNIGPGWLENSALPDYAKWCQDKGYYLIVKLHPAERAGFEDLKRKFPQVRFARPESDIYPLLRHVDTLVTDYSSVALDFMLLDRPIVFYWPDHETYTRQCRSLLPGHERYIAGEQATDFENLCRATGEAMAGGPGPWAERRRQLVKELFDQPDGQSADRVARLILEQLDAPEELPAGWGI